MSLSVIGPSSRLPPPGSDLETKVRWLVVTDDVLLHVCLFSSGGTSSERIYGRLSAAGLRDNGAVIKELSYGS